MTGEMTLPRLLRRNAQSIASRPAIREKRHGIWQSFSWAQYWVEVRDFALGLAASGFARSDKLWGWTCRQPLLWGRNSATSPISQ